MKKLMMATVFVLGTLAPAAQAQTTAAPSGRDIVLRSQKASGMDTVMSRHKTLTMTGTLSLPAMGVSAPITNYRSADNAFHLTVVVDGFGTVEQGYAEGVAYSISPQTGAEILTGMQAAQAKRQGLWIDGVDNYASLTNEGQEKYAGKDAYKVKMVSKDSITITRYFDVETGLPIATVSMSQTPDGPVDIVTLVSDYKNFGGVMFPTRQVQQVAGNEQIITMDKIEFDTAPATAFALPDAIKALKR